MSSPTERPAVTAPSRVSRTDQMPPWIPRLLVLIMVAVAGLGFAWWAFQRLRDLLVILLVAMFLSLAIEPGVNLLAARGIRRGVATMAVFVLLFASVVGFTVALGGLFVSELSSIVQKLPVYADQLIKLVNDGFGTRLSAEQLTKKLSIDATTLRSFGQSAATNVVDLSASVVGGLFKLLSVLLFGFYLSAEGPRFRRFVVSLFPPARQSEVLRAWEITIDKTGGYIYSRLLMAAVSFIAHWLFFTLLGVPYALALAAWVGVISQFIPTVGTYLAGALPMLVALGEQPLDALWILVFVLVYQQFENYLIQPRITAKTVQVHPATAFGSVIAGAALLGPVGAFIGIPVAASGQAFFSSYIRRYEVTDSTERRRELELIQAQAHRRPPAGNAPEPTGHPSADGSDAHGSGPHGSGDVNVSGGGAEDRSG